MSTTPNRFRWLGFLPLLCGLFVICYLAVTEESISTWIFPTGIVAFLMIGSGCRLLFRQRVSGWPGR